MAFARTKLDDSLVIKAEPDDLLEGQLKRRIGELLQLPPYKGSLRLRKTDTVKDIMEELDGTTHHPIDLTQQDPNKATGNPLQRLAKVPIKFLKFAEDVRPPYIGTYTRLGGDRKISRLARNPFTRELPNTNYDYDSEAEWEEPVEGEDLESEDEEDADDDDDDGDDMVDFLDDQGPSSGTRLAKRRTVLGDQQPRCTGICWEGSQGKPPNGELAGLDWRLFKLDILMGGYSVVF